MGKKAGILVVAVGLLAFMAGAVWLVMQDPAPIAPEGDDGSAASPSVAEPAATVDDATAPRKRKHSKGACAIFGEIKMRRDEAAAAGQEVVLARAGSDPRTVSTDEKGAFRFPALPRGGPYELQVASAGNATIRLPGIALDRKEERDVGTLWLDAAIDIEVQVKKMDGSAVAGASVQAYAVAQMTGNFDWTKRMAQIGESPIPVSSGVTDADGKFVFTEMASGQWTFTAEKEGLARSGTSTGLLSAKEAAKPVVIHLTTAFGLTGRVLDQDTASIPGALVMATKNNAGWNFASMPLHTRVTTDEEGKYEFTGLSAGDTAIWAARPGGVPARVATVRVPGVNQYDLYLRMGGTLNGTVTEKDTGEPVADVTVRAQGWSGGGTRVAEAVTDAEGKYVIDTLLEGTLNAVNVEREGWVQVHESGRPWQQIPLNRGDTITRDLVIRRAASLSGVVKGPDGPVADVKVFAHFRQQFGGSSNKQATTDKEGRYRFPALDQGTAVLQVMASGYYQPAFPQNVWTVLNQGTPPDEVSVKIPEQGEVTKDLEVVAGVSVSGTVKTQDGTPVAGAEVNAYGSKGSVKAKSDEGGAFTLEGVAPGAQINLIANKREDRYVGKSKQVQVHKDQPNEDVELTVYAIAKVRGTVTTQLAAELRDAYVQVSQSRSQRNNYYNPMQSSWQYAGRTPVAADGSYETDVPYVDGKFIVRASALHHESVASEPVEIVAGQQEYQVDVILRAGTSIKGRVLEKGSADGVSGASVTLSSRGGGGMRAEMMMVNVQQSGGVVVAVTDAAGAYEIQHVANGTYAVGASAEGYVPGSTSTPVPTKGDVNVNIEASQVITGTVTFADGKPVEGAPVQAVPVKQGNNRYFNPYGGSQVITGSDGSFRIPNLKSGDYRISVQPPWLGDVNIRPHTSQAVPAGTEGYRVTVEAGLTITGTLVGPEGKGLGAVWISANPEKPQPGMQGRNTSSKQDGTYEINGLSAGMYTLSVQTGWSGGGEASNYQPVTRKGVSAGDRDVELKMLAGLTIEGTVRDSSGNPISNRQLFAMAIHDPNNRVRGPTQNKNANSDAEGNFKFSGLSTGDYKITMQQGYNPFGTSSGDSGEILTGGDKVGAGSRDVQLTVTAGASISGIVVDEAGKPLSNVWVYANPTGGGNSGQPSMTDSDGKFKIRSLGLSGTYTVQARWQQLPPAKAEEVTPGTSGLRLEISQGAIVSGRLVDAGGNPIPNSSLQFRSTEKGNRTRARTQTDQNGNFQARGLQPGTYKVTMYRAVRQDNGSFISKNTDLGEVSAPSDNVELRAPAD